MPRRQGFVGREGELAAVLGLIADAADDQPGVALIHGEAGAGKTRLLDEVVSRLPPRTVVCRGAGVGFLGGRIPYAPLVAALRSLLARLPRADVPRVLGADPGDITLLLPELGVRHEGPSDQARLIAAVSSLLDRAAAIRPTVLVLDDLHCADVATLEVLAYLSAALDRQRLALVVAFRPDEVDEVLGEWLQDVRRASHVVEVGLAPMSLAETRAQLTDLLGGDPRALLGESLTARIHARSGGYPYAAEALMRAALAGDEGTLPASLREVLVRRTRACTPGTAEVLRMVAAAGERVAPGLLDELVARSRAEVQLDDSIDEAVRAQLLVVEADGSLSLRHALLAEALYADLLPGERRTLHALLVAALEDVADARPGVIAEHADRAGDSARALLWSLRAAQAAEDVYAWDEAHRQYVRVRRLWPSVPDAENLVGADAVDVFSRAAAIAAICDHDVDAVEIIEGVRSWLHADPDVDPVRMGVLEAKYARFLLDSGRTDAALVSARRAVALVPADPPTPERGVVVSGLVHVMDWMGGGSDWEPLADEAVEVARAIGDRAALARALIIRTTVRPGSPDVVQDAREAVDLAIAGDGDSELVAQTYSNLVDCLSCADLGREGIDVAAVGMAAASSRGLGIRYGSWLATQAAEIATVRGWWDEAEGFVDAALVHTRHVQGINRDYALVMRARLASLRGDWDRMDADIAEINRLPVVLDLLRCEALAEAQLWRGAPDAALATVVDYAGTATPRLLAMSAPLAWLGCRALADVGDGRRRTGSGAPGGAGWDATAAVIDELVESACGPGAVVGVRPAELRVLCAAERSRYEEGPGVAPWRAAVDALVDADRSYLLAYARWRLAQAQVTERALAAAAESLRLSHADAGRLGAAPLLAEIESLARRTRIDLRPPRRMPAGVAGVGADLTAREREILGHLAAGRTNGEIAKALVISTKTASVHVSNILRKLEVPSRYEAAEIAERYLVD
jgi:DNA-binding CsgD family transcriptional regulator/type II secretory pathway predicted ATPase ExeA